MAIASVQYSEFKKENLEYRSVTISNIGKSKGDIIFNSGDFVKDWYFCNKYILTELSNNERISNSSSVDHFIMDGAPFDSAWLMVNDSTCFLQYKYSENGIEFFVKEGTQPTWKELMAICGDSNKNLK